MHNKWLIINHYFFESKKILNTTFQLQVDAISEPVYGDAKQVRFLIMHTFSFV